MLLAGVKAVVNTIPSVAAKSMQSRSTVCAKSQYPDVNCNVATVGFNVGDVVGEPVGDVVGNVVGEPVGDVVGEPVGDVVGEPVGEPVGDFVGDVVGEPVGTADGASVFVSQ